MKTQSSEDITARQWEKKLTKEVLPTDPKQKMEFSKKILLYLGAWLAILTLGTFVLVWKTSDVAPLQYLIVGASSGLSTALGFYYWKAKPEARLKILLEAKRQGIKLPLDDIDQELYQKSEEET